MQKISCIHNYSVVTLCHYTCVCVISNQVFTDGVRRNLVFVVAQTEKGSQFTPMIGVYYLRKLPKEIGIFDEKRKKSNHGYKSINVNPNNMYKRRFVEGEFINI